MNMILEKSTTMSEITRAIRAASTALRTARFERNEGEVYAKYLEDAAGKLDALGGSGATSTLENPPVYEFFCDPRVDGKCRLKVSMGSCLRLAIIDTHLYQGSGLTECWPTHCSELADMYICDSVDEFVGKIEKFRQWNES